MTDVYLDNNASTRLCPEAREEMLVHAESYANPSSAHPTGLVARRNLETSRAEVAALLGCAPESVVFTSGGTESNNLAILGIAGELTSPRHFITSAVEHASVLRVFQHLESRGHSVTYLPVDRDGNMSLDDLRGAITAATVLLSFMAVNNETGVAFPIAAIGKIARESGVLLHCDAVQAAGKMPVAVEELGVDLLSLSAHKIHGPKGSGALYVRDYAKVCPRVFGGGQERGLRSGTEPLPAITGFGAACKAARERMTEAVAHIESLRDRLERGLLDAIPEARVIGDRRRRVCNTTNIHFTGISGAELFAALCDARIYASRGSACNAHSSDNGGHVLSAMGLGQPDMSASIRFSLSRETRVEEVDRVTDVVPRLVADLREKRSIKSAGDTAAVGPRSAPSVYDRLAAELEEVWGVTRGDPEVMIAVLDGPADVSHPCFQGALLEIVPTLEPRERRAGAASRHGTMVASILFGQPGSAVRGVAPRCRGIVVPIFHDLVGGGLAACSQDDLARAILLAAQQGAHIINISGGMLDDGRPSSQLLLGAIELCRDAGIILVAAAGNQGCACAHLPASLDGVLTVGAMDSEGRAVDTSNWGESYRGRGILAPGKDIVGAVPGGRVSVGTGTSYAAPYVAGLLGLFLSIQRSQTGAASPGQAVAALFEGARACDPKSGHSCERHLEGEVNIAGALARLNDLLHARRRAPGASMDERAPDPSNLRKDRMFMNDVDSSGQAPAPQPREAAARAAAASPRDAQIHPSDCSGSGAGQPIYALGTIGVDFIDESRRNSFAQSLANPTDHRQIHQHLEVHPYDADNLVWTLSIGGAPVYALRPRGNFGAQVYQRLRETLKAQYDEGVQIVSVPGYVTGSVKVASGADLKILAPELRGLYSWSTKALVEKLAGARPSSDAEADSWAQKSVQIEGFLERVYYEFRNSGGMPQERALNYAATNAFQVGEVFTSALREGLVLSSVTVERTPIARAGAECWDVKLIFFNPQKRTELARKAYRFTVDVSDVIPFMTDKVRSWYLY